VQKSISTPDLSSIHLRIGSMHGHVLFASVTCGRADPVTFVISFLLDTMLYLLFRFFSASPSSKQSIDPSRALWREPMVAC